jgi:hypothetical protein
MLIYATPADLAAPPWSLSPLPTDVDARLLSASLLVARATRSAVYDVDETGAPTDPTIITALRDATCSQVVTWAALGIDPRAAGADAATSSGRVATTRTLGPATLAYAGTEAATARRAATATTITLEAHGILDAAGLLPGTIRVHG